MQLWHKEFYELKMGVHPDIRSLKLVGGRMRLS